MYFNTNRLEGKGFQYNFPPFWLGKPLVIFATFFCNNNYFILKTLPIKSESSAISSHSCSSPSSCSFASLTSMFSSFSAANFLACSSNWIAFLAARSLLHEIKSSWFEVTASTVEFGVLVSLDETIAISVGCILFKDFFVFNTNASRSLCFLDCLWLAKELTLVKCLLHNLQNVSWFTLFLAFSD